MSVCNCEYGGGGRGTEGGREGGKERSIEGSREGGGADVLSY